MPYQFAEQTEETTVEVEAITIEDLFSLSCHAWRDAALESGDTSSTDWKSASFSAENFEGLLLLLLDELNSLLNSKKWVFNSVDKLDLYKQEDLSFLDADIYGEPLNEEIHQLKKEIKTVNFRKMKIEKIGEVFTTKIVFGT